MAPNTKSNEEIVEEFIQAYCVKRPAQPIRWIRSIFYDDTEQIETILDFMRNALTLKDQAHKAEVEIAINEERKRCIDAITQVVAKYHLDARDDDYTSGLFWGAKEAQQALYSELDQDNK